MDRATELLAAIGRAEWDRVEDSAFELLHSGRFRVPEARAATIILVAEARLFGRLDARGALTLLAPLLATTDVDALGTPWAARAWIVATTALRAPGAASELDPDRRLRRLLGARAVRIDRDDLDLRARRGLAMAGAGMVVPPVSLVRRHGWLAGAALDRGCSPVTRCLLAELRAVHAGLRPDPEGRRRAIATGLALASSLAYHASEARLRELADAGLFP